MGFVIDLAKIVKDFLGHWGIETEGFCCASDDEVPFVDFPRLDDLTHGKGDFFLGDILDFIPTDAGELHFMVFVTGSPIEDAVPRDGLGCLNPIEHQGNIILPLVAKTGVAKDMDA